MNPFAHGKRHEIGLDLFVKGFEKDQLANIYLGLTNTSETDRLILECATLDEMDSEYNIGEPLDEEIYEAVTVRRFSQTDSRMKALSRVFSKYLADGITPAEAIIGRPKKTGLFASVTAQIPFSDGQVITIVFHSPGGDAKKIGPDDEIIAYRWLLNKRDITHVVSPEGEGEVTLEEVGKRIAQLVGKNSARFQTTQKDVKAQNDQLAALKADADKLSKENMDLMNGLKDQQDAVAAAQSKIDRTRGLVEKQQEINADLENQLAALQAKATAAEADKKVAEETAAKQSADDAAAQADTEAQRVADEAQQAAADAEAQRIAMEAHQKQEAENAANVDEYNRLVTVGQGAIPGIRPADAEAAGKVWEFFQGGGMTQAEWDKYAEDLYASGKAARPAPVPEPEVVTPVDEPTPVDDGKLPFEMTKAEFSALWKSRIPFYRMRWPAPLTADDAHLELIKEAIADGETIRPEILAEYPELSSHLEPVQPPGIEWGDRTDEEHDRLKSVGLNVLPDINPLFAEDAGDLWEKLQRGEATQEQWDKFVKTAVQAPAAVTIANDIISGKYDSLPLKEILNLSEPIWDLDEDMYHDLMSQADAHLTKLTSDAAAKALGA